MFTKPIPARRPVQSPPAAAVTTPGTELCRRADVERLFEQIRDDA
jgi:hypothetical protein